MCFVILEDILAEGKSARESDSTRYPSQVTAHPTGSNT